MSALSNPSLFVKLFLFLSFFLAFGRVFSALMLCKPGFYFLFRNNFSFNTVSGENKAVTPEMVAGWNETTFPTLLSNYGLENIYNAVEFGLFYECSTNKSCQLKKEKCSGCKHSKIRITGLAAANAVCNINYLCLLLVKQKVQGVLKTLRNFPVDIDHKERTGWIVFYLKNW